MSMLKVVQNVSPHVRSVSKEGIIELFLSAWVFVEGTQDLLHIIVGQISDDRC